MTFELPKLSEMKETLSQVNSLMQSLDDKKLSILKSITSDIVKLQALGGNQGLGAFSQVMTMIAAVPPEKLDKVACIVADIRDTALNIQKLVKMLPPDVMKSLPIEDLVGEVKKAVTGVK